LDFGAPAVADEDEGLTIELNSEWKGNTRGRRLIVLVAGLALTAFVVRATVVGLAAVTRSHSVVRWTPATCTIPGGAISVITTSDMNAEGKHLDWGHICIHVTVGERALIAYDTVDGERHGQLATARARFPPLAKPPSDAADTQPLEVPCALNSAFSDSCDSLTCRRATKPLGGACCSGRVVLGSSPEQLRGYVQDGLHAQIYFMLLVVLSLSATLCHLYVFSAQAKTRVRSLETRVQLLKSSFQLRPGQRPRGGVHELL